MDTASLSSVDLDTLKTWRDDALVARHKLAMGRATASFMVAGRRKEFTEANLDKLDAYVSSLTAEITGRESGITNAGRGRPLYVGLGF